MNVLLVSPQFPDTFWSFTCALSFIGKKSAFPPRGLLTVAALLPKEWSRLVSTAITLSIYGCHYRRICELHMHGAG